MASSALESHGNDVLPKLLNSLAFDQLHTVLYEFQENPTSADVWVRLLEARRAAAALIAVMSPTEKSGLAMESALSILHALEESGAADLPAAAEDLALADEFRTRKWPGLLAAMLLAPAWQSPAAPELDCVAPWLWPEYTRWLFYTPKGFAACGQAMTYATHYLRRLEELAGWGTRNRGSAAVRGALEVFLRVGNFIPLYFSPGSLRRHCELRGKILALAAGVGPQEEMIPLPRDGRRLRVGVVNRHFGQQTETYGTLPTFEHLDPERFEVVLFAHHATFSKVEEHCRQRAAEFHILPPELDAQVATIRAANLDIITFGTNVTAVFHEVTQLALYRLAPLQVINMSSCTTSGFPECDLYISGALTEVPEAAGHFSERLGLIPGPAHAFQYEVDRQEATATFSRATLGLPDDALVFVSAANYFKVIPEMQHAWARLLAAVPGSRLLVHPFNPNWASDYPIKRFCAEFERVLAQYGVASERLVVSSNKFPSRNDVKALLAVGDIYLDTYPFGGVNSLVDPLELGMPAITWEGNTFRSRMGGALLRSLQLEELVAGDEASYQALAVALAGDAARRDALREKIRGAMDRGAIFLDTLAHSDAFGEVLLAAYDELVNLGRDDFRRTRTAIALPAEPQPDETLRAGVTHLEAGALTEAVDCARRVLRTDPAAPGARHLLGRVLLALGNPERALTYLLAAVPRLARDSRFCFDLALALRATGSKTEALQALEAALRLDEQNRDGWFLLLEMAEELGHDEMSREVRQVLQHIAPGDPRISARPVATSET